MRLRRTLLFVNGNRFDKLEEGLNSEVDGICIELEDLVPPNQKEEARLGCAKMLTEIDFKGKERIVRINHPSTEWGKKDLEMILPLLPDAIRLPKAENVEDILELDKLLTKIEKEKGVPKNTVEIILTLESPLGIFNCPKLATCCDRVTGIGLGAGDLTSAMGITRSLDPNSDQLLFAKQMMIMAGKLGGLQVFDTTVITPPGQEGSLDEFIKKDTEHDKELGFTGRSVSMIPHIKIINDVYAPTLKEYEEAKRIIDGYNKALTEGVNEIFVEGHFLDAPVVAAYQKKIEYYELVQKRKNS